MKRCPCCQKRVREEDRYCPNCGYKLFGLSAPLSAKEESSPLAVYKRGLLILNFIILSLLLFLPILSNGNLLNNYIRLWTILFSKEDNFLNDIYPFHIALLTMDFVAYLLLFFFSIHDFFKKMKFFLAVYLFSFFSYAFFFMEFFFLLFSFDCSVSFLGILPLVLFVVLLVLSIISLAKLVASGKFKLK